MAVVNPSLTGTYYGSFNATSQYLTVPSNAAFQFGTGNFTIEFWVKFNNVVNQQALIDLRSGVSNSVTPCIYFYLGYIRYYVSAADRIVSTRTVQANIWYHIALVKSSNVTTLFIDGNKTGSTYADTNTYVITAPWIGRFNDGVTGLTYLLNGQMSNLRIVKGTAVYTDNFVPSTDPLTNITNTSLLTLQDSTVIDNGTANGGSPFTITNVGSISTTSLIDGRYGIENKSINVTLSSYVNSPIITRKSVLLFENTNINGALAYNKLPIPKSDARENWGIFDPMPIKSQNYIPVQYQFWS
jgi:hypothetical protein